MIGLGWLVILTVAVLSAAVTSAVRAYALKRHVLDRPGPRSSHERPTPRGGGLAVAVTSLAAVIIAALAGWLEPRVAYALVGGGPLVALVGWIDDHRNVPARVRLLAHFAAAAWALWWLGGYPVVAFGPWTLRLAIAGPVIAALGIVWCINFYNFMDGIDGIAAIEGLAAGIAGGWLLLGGGRPGLALAAFALAAGLLGFLPWNWPPARIFLGDVGSGFVGFYLATLAVASENLGGPPVTVWALLLGVFVFDATVTLARRFRRRNDLVSGHRDHAYQRAVQSGLSHRTVTLGVLGFNLLLVGLASAGAVYPRALPWCVAASLALLTAGYAAVERRKPMPPTRSG